MSHHVDLGFVENCESWQVESRLFPSKIGGKPAWLSLENIPNQEKLQCTNCQMVLTFLCQIYAPFEEDDNNFHRTLFVFICRNANCNVRNASGNIKVFRSSLQRRNKFYSYEPPEEDKEDATFSLTNWVTLCKLCGCLSSKKCSKCHSASYCSREHQILDWKEGHKNECSKEIKPSSQFSSKLFTEWEIVIEPEELKEEKTTNEHDELAKYTQMVAENKAGTMLEILETDLEMHAAPNQDKTFTQFRKKIEENPEQILRYERGGQPLWIAESPKPNNDDVPNCEYCGSNRQFEVQIMPQLLTILKETELDWGVIAIYTCTESCVDGGFYGNEFVFKQDVAIN